MGLGLRWFRLGLLMLLSALTACQSFSPEVKIEGPTTAQATRKPVSTKPTGSIWADARSGRTLFEDKLAADVGDIIQVQISESQQASQDLSTKSSRTGSVGASLPGLSAGGINISPLSTKGSTSTNFEGTGSTSSNNRFNGTLTATVVGVLPNGYLKIAGEKQIGINRDVEVIRLSGVVNPSLLRPGNIITSQQVADVRLAYKGKGGLDETQGIGWLSRFFMAVSPF